jgi:hypothetical protein
VSGKAADESDELRHDDASRGVYLPTRHHGLFSNRVK